MGGVRADACHAEETQRCARVRGHGVGLTEDPELRRPEQGKACYFVSQLQVSCKSVHLRLTSINLSTPGASPQPQARERGKLERHRIGPAVCCLN